MDFVRILAVLFGITMIALGIAGFVPSLVTDGNLFGYFQIDVMHNLVHLLTGVIALFASAKRSYARWYFRIFGLVYGIVAIAGVVSSGNVMVMHVNMADNILHALIAVVALYIGFAFKKSAA